MSDFASPPTQKPSRSVSVSNYEKPSFVYPAAFASHPLVFLVDLIHFVLFLIDPVRCNGGVIDLNPKPYSYRSRAAEDPLRRG